MTETPSITPTDDERASAADLRKRAAKIAATRQEHLDRAGELNRSVTALNKAADLIDGGQATLPGTDPAPADNQGAFASTSAGIAAGLQAAAGANQKVAAE